jgi:hypothetical protein
MSWLWLLLGGAFVCWAAIFSFNLWATAKARKHYGYTWDQVKTHVCLRGALMKRRMWHRAMGPHLARFIKTLNETEVVAAAWDQRYMANFLRFLEKRQQD